MQHAHHTTFSQAESNREDIHAPHAKVRVGRIQQIAPRCLWSGSAKAADALSLNAQLSMPY
jgi:hypothetical protein